MERLCLLDQEENYETSKENLEKLVEAHLSMVTFDNLSQHGLPFPPKLDVKALTNKILDNKRGGFCFELNGLFAELLLELGYHVKRVPAIVYASSEIGFRHEPTHLILIVSTPSAEEVTMEWVVDVGFGEPAIHPLQYTMNIEQKTPEGMISKLIQCKEDPHSVELHWKPHTSDNWIPRLRWDWKHPGQELSDFQSALDVILAESSIFSQKLIVCKITRDEKISLAGTRFKRTSPRFGPDKVETIEQYESLEKVQSVLKEDFEILDSEGLDLTQSKKAASEVWSQM